MNCKNQPWGDQVEAVIVRRVLSSSCDLWDRVPPLQGPWQSSFQLQLDSLVSLANTYRTTRNPAWTTEVIYLADLLLRICEREVMLGLVCGSHRWEMRLGFVCLLFCYFVYLEPPAEASLPLLTFLPPFPELRSQVCISHLQASLFGGF